MIFFNPNEFCSNRISELITHKLYLSAKAISIQRIGVLYSLTFLIVESPPQITRASHIDEKYSVI